jgi:hypothetical protein
VARTSLQVGADDEDQDAGQGWTQLCESREVRWLQGLGQARAPVRETMKAKTRIKAGSLAKTEGVSEMGEDHWKLVNHLR